ncbi:MULTISPECIES: IncL/M-type plasmid replication leader peptide RepB, partial [Enterobacteriaceae]
MHTLLQYSPANMCRG